MRYLKKFNENSKVSQYTKGEVLIFLKPDHRHMDCDDIANELGYELIDTSRFKMAWAEMGDAILVSCESGKEDICGSDFMDNYPEFFSGYERRDIRDEDLYKKINDLTDRAETLADFVGHKFISDDWNKELDEIIELAKSMKF